METRITVNGVEYRSVDEMPPDVRQQYDRAMKILADRDGNGVPDIRQGKAPSGQASDAGDVKNVVTTVTRTSRYFINGREYQRLEDIPADLRAMLGRAGAKPRIDPDTSARSDSAITLRLSWSTLFALLAAAAATALIVWLIR